MIFWGRFIKLAVVVGLFSQLLMSAYMTSMTLERQGLKAAQNSFYTAVSGLSDSASSDFSLCLSGASSDGEFEDCIVCKALIGFGVYTLATLPVEPLSIASFEAVLPVFSTHFEQVGFLSGYIRGPPPINV